MIINQEYETLQLSKSNKSKQLADEREAQVDTLELARIFKKYNKTTIQYKLTKMALVEEALSVSASSSGTTPNVELVEKVVSFTDTNGEDDEAEEMQL